MASDVDAAVVSRPKIGRIRRAISTMRGRRVPGERSARRNRVLFVIVAMWFDRRHRILLSPLTVEVGVDALGMIPVGPPLPMVVPNANIIQ